MKVEVKHGFLKNLQIAIHSEATVLITGPTGVGKTTWARKIHSESSRGHKPFVAVNLASLHEGTLESELFGHERGAFTGADLRRVGRLEAAQGGTVFLDEIGELSLRMQARLLDFIQTKKIVPVGSNRETVLDVRLIVATHRDLPLEIREKRFREDLFHRIRVINCALKPLCERVNELDGIVHRCIEELSQQHKKPVFKISEQVAQSFERYSWPGNIRELRNVLEAAIVASTSPTLEKWDLPEWFLESEAKCRQDIETKALIGVATIPMTIDYHQTQLDFEKEYFTTLLKSGSFSLEQKAKKIGMSKATFFRRLKTLGISTQKKLEIQT